MQTTDYYKIGTVTRNHMIVYKLWVSWIVTWNIYNYLKKKAYFGIK